MTKRSITQNPAAPDSNNVMIIYAHGLKLNPAEVSAKGKLLSKELGAVTPDLPVTPQEAITVLEDLILAHSNVMLVGHSLGGFYVTYLAEKYNLPIILTNPSVRPQESDLLSGILGDDKNLKNAVRAKIAAYDVPITHPDNFLVMLQRNDQILDYRDALNHYHNCNLVVLNGGSHRWDDFESFLPIVEYFYKRNYGETHE